MTAGGGWVLGTSWKMNKTLAEAEAWVDRVLAYGVPPGIECFVLPPHTALHTVARRVPADSRLAVGAQNAHWAAEGAGTGEVSMRMVRDAGATLVEVGHVERRTEFGETDGVVALKVAAALQAGLTPLVCVGEPASVTGTGGAASHVQREVRHALARVAPADAHRVRFAYEPHWAVGRSGHAADPHHVATVVRAVREEVTSRATGGAPGPVVLYGGSVDESSLPGLVEAEVADGLFVGRAGWSAEGFLALLDLCAAHLTRLDPCATA